MCVGERGERENCSLHMSIVTVMCDLKNLKDVRIVDLLFTRLVALTRQVNLRQEKENREVVRKDGWDTHVEARNNVTF